eukprot:1004837-Rhodomonas_salina.5
MAGALLTIMAVGDSVQACAERGSTSFPTAEFARPGITAAYRPTRPIGVPGTDGDRRVVLVCAVLGTDRAYGRTRGFRSC